MTNKELKILFLRTKLDNESKNLNFDDFYKLVKHKIGWKQYNQMHTEFVNNSLFDYNTHTELTEIGLNELKSLETEYKQEIKDENLKRKKLHNDAIISEWKRKTFWLVFILGLFGGNYSAIDLFSKLLPKKEKGQIQKESIINEVETEEDSLIID